jgi:hypothetical protein
MEKPTITIPRRLAEDLANYAWEHVEQAKRETIDCARWPGAPGVKDMAECIVYRYNTWRELAELLGWREEPKAEVSNV